MNREFPMPAAALVTVDATDATQAALLLTSDMLSTLSPQIDAFLAVYRRGLRPEALQVAESVSQLLEDADIPLDDPLEVPYRVGALGDAREAEAQAPAPEQAKPA